MKLARNFLAIACLLALPSFVQAQVEIEIPRIDLGGGAIQFSTTGGDGFSVSVSVNNGVKTIKGKSGTEKVEIVEDPDNGIKVKLTERYGPDDADKIEKSMPGLYMHLKSIPKTVDNAKVDVLVDVTREYEADDKKDLENKHPEVYKVYKKYTENRTAGFRMGRPGAFRVIEMPRVVRPADLEEKMKAMEEEIKKKMKEMELRVPDIGVVPKIEIIKNEEKDRDEKKEQKKSDDKKGKKDTKRNDG